MPPRRSSGSLLCADKEAALLFCFLGYYPLLKPKIDAISSKVLRLLLKVALCTVSMGLMYALIIFVFKLPAVVQEFSETAAWLLWVTAATGLALFSCMILPLTGYRSFIAAAVVKSINTGAICYRTYRKNVERAVSRCGKPRVAVYW